MPLIGSDFTVQQRQALRVIADYIKPGLTDSAVLGWATAQGVDAAMREAYRLFVNKVQEKQNEERRTMIDPIQQVIDQAAGPPPGPGPG